ncbi:MAG: chromosome segregation protein SMC, partial [Hyphomonadaceae bacterium]
TDKLRGEISGLADAATLIATLNAAKAKEDASEIALHDAERAVEAAETELAAARETEDEARTPRDEADKAMRSLEAEITGLQRLLRKADTPSAPPVLDRIRTQDGYEKAVASALGDDLQAPTDRSAAMFWAGAYGNDQALPAGARPLSDFTEAPDELAARLSQCGVVDAGEGASLASQLRPGQRLVSKDGHLWRWDGFTRTPNAPVAAAERLEQQARLEIAQTEIGPARETLNTANSDLSEAKGHRIACDDALRDARNEVQPLSKELRDANSEASRAAQEAERADMKRDASKEALGRVEADLRSVSEALALITSPGDAEDDQTLEVQLGEARTSVNEAREAETEMRGRLTDLTHGREQAEKRRSGLTRDVEEWTRRTGASATRLEALIARRNDTRASAETARTSPETLQADLDRLAAEVEAFETGRKTAADTLAAAEATAREAETAAREATNAAARARETMAGAKVKIETAEARFVEVTELARAQFQRTPEGLLMLAQAGLDEEAMEELDQRETERRTDILKRDRDQLGGVNMEAESEAEELAARLGNQATEKQDLTAAIAKLREGVDALNNEGRDRLLEAFETVNEHFKALFKALFRGGQAELRLVDADDPLAAGLEIFAQPPGKKLGTLRLMSGGEQALTAAALIFAVFLSNPAPICVLDEVDAPLDDANVDRFCRMLDEMRTRTNTRFVIITHNPVTMSRMDRLFGVTMREKGVSKLVSVDLNAAEEMIAA